MRTKIKLSLKLLENELAAITSEQKNKIFGGGGGGVPGINDTTGIFTQLQGRLNHLESTSSVNMGVALPGSEEYGYQNQTFNKANDLNNIVSTLASMYDINIYMAAPGQSTSVKPTSTNSFDIFLNPAANGDANQALLMHELTHINDVRIGNMMVLETTVASSLITTAPSGPPTYGFKGADLFDEERAYLNQNFIEKGSFHYADKAKTEKYVSDNLSDPMYDNLEWADKNVWNNYESTQNITTAGAGSSTTEGSYITTFYGN